MKKKNQKNRVSVRSEEITNVRIDCNCSPDSETKERLG